MIAMIEVELKLTDQISYVWSEVEKLEGFADIRFDLATGFKEAQASPPNAPTNKIC